MLPRLAVLKNQYFVHLQCHASQDLSSPDILNLNKLQNKLLMGSIAIVS